jgi:CRISPR-associated endonuclease/helicase Cas3
MEPYPFQRQVAERLLSGHNVILQAPTGAGKTAAALLPFLDAMEYGQDFPRKCLYTVPMRVLANQFVAEYEARVKRAGRDDRISVAIQTGERADDRTLSASLTFATIDQVLSSFLLSPYSLPRRLGNLNAGAVAASYLVFDEFHLFDPVSTLPTTLEMLRMLRGVTPFLLMTATFSGEMLTGLAHALNADLVPDDAAQWQALQSLPSQNKVRRYHFSREPLSADVVLERHRNRTLVICNVVDRARALFEALRDHPGRQDTQLLLLHSRFRKEDRQRIEGQIRRLFGKGADETGRWILVSTQVVEVGLDISCETMHTEIAPANAALQRSGRCARYEGDNGDVYVYGSATGSDGQEVDLVRQIMPYNGQAGEVARTAEAFQAQSGQVLTFGDEQEIVSSVHGPRDRSIVQGLIGTREMHRRRMNGVMSGRQSSDAGNLVRAISSRLVVVHDDPNTVLEHPFAAESFAFHSGSVYGLVDRWLKRENLVPEDAWPVLALKDQGDTEERGQSSFQWVPVERKEDIGGAALVLVHPALAGYNSELGFLTDRGTGYRACLLLPGAEETHESFGYRLESYEEHASLVYEAFQRLSWPEMARTAARLEKVHGWPLGVLERAANLVALLHDAGKLNGAWQQWILRYQRAIGRPVTKGYYAHSDFEPGNELHRETQQAMGRKPAHAVEGAVAVVPLLAAAMGDCGAVLNAAFTAIARHHGSFTSEYRRYSLVPGAEEAVAETLLWLPAHLAMNLRAGDILKMEDPARTKIQDLLVQPQDDGQFLAYILLARALRKADQKGTSLGSKRTESRREVKM